MPFEDDDFIVFDNDAKQNKILDDRKPEDEIREWFDYEADEIEEQDGI